MNEPSPQDLELADCERDLGLRGTFADFVEMAWPHVFPETFVPNWHIGVIGEELDAVYEGETKKVSFCLPPGCMKSRLVDVFWPVRCWIKRPKMSFFSTSFDGDLTLRDARYSIELIRSDWFQERWGDIVNVKKWAAVGDHHNSAGGWRFSTSVGGKATGRHPDVKIIDDPSKPAAVSPTTLAETEAYFNNTLRSRGPRGATVLIMQRLAVRDLAGVMEEEGARMVVLPMRFEPARAYSNDPRKTEGELLWPALYNEAVVKELERMPARDRAAQLQQRPVPDGGTLIKEDWIQWYTPGEQPRRFAQTVNSWDLTFKATANSDFVAGQAWGYTGVDFYLLDAVLERLDFVESRAAILKMLAKFPGASVLVEAKANGPAVMNTLENVVPGLVGVEPEGGKAARLNAASPLFEAKNVWLPRGNPIAEKLALSLCAFPANAWDDDVDACSQALTYLHQGTVDYAAAMRKLRGRML